MRWICGASLLTVVSCHYDLGIAVKSDHDGGRSDAASVVEPGAGGAAGRAGASGAGPFGAAAGGAAASSESGGRAGAAPTLDAGSGPDAGARSPSPSDAASDARNDAPAIGPDGAVQDGIPTAALVLWLRADRGVTEKDGHVSLWHDQSGGGTDASQTTAAAQPTLILTGGVPAVSFDGTAQYLNLPNIGAAFSEGLSIFSATALDKQPVECSAILEMSTGFEENDISFGDYMGTQYFEVLDAFGTAATIDTGKLHLLGVVHSVPGVADLRQDGTPKPVSIAPMAADAVRTQNFVGRTLYDKCTPLAGRVHELLLYSRAVTANEATGIESALTRRWAR